MRNTIKELGAKISIKATRVSFDFMNPSRLTNYSPMRSVQMNPASSQEKTTSLDPVLAQATNSERCQLLTQFIDRLHRYITDIPTLQGRKGQERGRLHPWRADPTPRRLRQSRISSRNLERGCWRRAKAWDSTIWTNTPKTIDRRASRTHPSKRVSTAILIHRKDRVSSHSLAPVWRKLAEFQERRLI